MGSMVLQARLVCVSGALLLSGCAGYSAASLPFFPGVHDMGIVMPFGGCPGDCDVYGARDTWLFYDATDVATPFHMYYDGSGPDSWIASLAVSADPTLRSWTKRGTVLSLGPRGSRDEKSASYLTTFEMANGSWAGLYLATNVTSPPPFSVPVGPYYTMLATAPASSGPWMQHRSLGPVIAQGSPGPIMPSMETPGEWWQFCTGCGAAIGLATATSPLGYWSEALALITDPVENFSLYFEEATATYFGFTNHIGPDAHGMAFDDSIWVYWTQNITAWPAGNKAVILNRSNVVEPSFQTGRVGLPSVLRVPGNDRQLALLYDGGGTPGGVSYNENCSVALAWLDLPLTPPPARGAAGADERELSRSK